MSETIHQFWHKGEIDTVGKLSAKSILAQGHKLWIWGYNIHQFNESLLPYLRHAEDILPRDVIPKCAECPHFGRQYEVLVSEFFRFQVLYKLGGWWLDNDIILFKKISWPQPIGVRSVNGTAFPNVLYIREKQTNFALDCFKNLNLNKWNENINKQLIHHRVYKWEIPTRWFGEECDLRYFQYRQMLLPQYGVHICRGWAKKMRLLERPQGLLYNLRKKYQV